MVLQDFIPKLRGFSVVANAERIFQSTTDFIRGNPIVSTASVGAGVTGLVVAGATIRKLRSKKKSTKRKSTKKSRIKRKKIRGGRVRKRTKRITHRTPRHRGHKKVTFTTKGGKRVSFLVKKPAHSHKKLKRGKR